MDPKEVFMACHEELVEDAMERNPSLTWQQAYDATADLAHEAMIDRFADAVDMARMRAKEEG